MPLPVGERGADRAEHRALSGFRTGRVVLQKVFQAQLQRQQTFAVVRAASMLDVFHDHRSDPLLAVRSMDEVIAQLYGRHERNVLMLGNGFALFFAELRKLDAVLDCQHKPRSMILRFEHRINGRSPVRSLLANPAVGCSAAPLDGPQVPSLARR